MKDDPILKMTKDITVAVLENDNSIPIHSGSAKLIADFMKEIYNGISDLRNEDE